MLEEESRANVFRVGGGGKVSKEKPPVDPYDVGLGHEAISEQPIDPVVAIDELIAEQADPPSSELVGVCRIKGDLDASRHGPQGYLLQLRLSLSRWKVLP